MAEALLRHRLSAAGIDAHVHSAGIARAGLPATEEGVEILSARGIDNTAHRSRRMTYEMIRDADLVIAMTRGHVREAALMCREAWPRTFTLKELVRRGEELGARAADQSLDEWLGKVGAGRKPSDLIGSHRDDDVADPYGMSAPAYERRHEELDDLVNRLASLIWRI